MRGDPDAGLAERESTERAPPTETGVSMLMASGNRRLLGALTELRSEDEPRRETDLADLGVRLGLSAQQALDCLSNSEMNARLSRHGVTPAGEAATPEREASAPAARRSDARSAFGPPAGLVPLLVGRGACPSAQIGAPVLLGHLGRELCEPGIIGVEHRREAGLGL